MHTELSGTGPASWVVLVSAGQEALDSFARSLETGFRNCEIAVKPGDTTWTGVPFKASAETPDHKVVRRSIRAPGQRAKDGELEPPQRGAARRTLLIRKRLSAPRPLIAPGRKAAEGFGAGGFCLGAIPDAS